MRPLTSVGASLLGLAAVTALTAPAVAQCPAADSFEPNDACVTATMVTAGTTTGLTCFGQANASGENQDFFQVDVPTGNTLTVDLTFLNVNGDTDLYLYDNTSPNCGGEGTGDYLVRGFSASDNEQVNWANTTGSTQTYWIMVDPFGTTYDCNDYDLTITIAPDMCSTSPDDAFEDNDDCSMPTPMNDGSYTGLFVSKSDEDFYEVQVADGDTLTVDIFFSTATADLDLYLYDDQIACGDLTSYLVNGFSTTDNESVSWTNSSGALETYYVQVVVWDGSTGDCNDYDMDIAGSGGVVAQPFCFGDGTADAGGGPVSCPCGNESALGAGEGCNNSLGFGAILTAAGTSIVANDDLVFSVAQAIPNQPSLLVQGATEIAVPFKDGVLCMGTPTERVEVVFLDGNGEGSTASSIVTNGNVSPGDTRYYQQWYRNPGGVSPCGTGSNFSQGLIVNWL